MDVADSVPRFSSGTSARVSENATGTVYTAVATPDVAGDAIVYSLSGADAGRFDIHANTGAVSFRTGPDFEDPRDVGRNNVYDIVVTATDAGTAMASSQAVTITVADVLEAAPAPGSDIAVSFVENGTGPVLTAAAPPGGSGAGVVYSLSGLDAARFDIGAGTGVLTFRTAPDHEAPADGGGDNVYDVVVTASEANLPAFNRAVAITVTDVADEAPLFKSATRVSFAENGMGVVYTAPAVPGGSVTYSLAGADAGLFDLHASTGVLRFLTAPDFETPGGVQANNLYSVRIRAVDGAGHGSEHDVQVEVTDLLDSSAQMFSLWEVAAAAHAGDASLNINALNDLSAQTMVQRDATDRTGRANQRDAALSLPAWIDAVTGTDVVSAAEFVAGFSVTGKAAAGLQGSLQFLLDKDRTTGAAGEGAQVIRLGSNDVNGDGQSDVSVTYDNVSGEWTMTFAAQSAALAQAVHNTWSSGVHQLVMDKDGDGLHDSDEVERLFLVASGTARSTDAGLVQHNYSVHDRLSKHVFVYYYGDPDGAGVGLWTAMDPGDRPAEAFVLEVDRDAKNMDWDYYNVGVGAADRQATVANTALHWVTTLPAQVWEFHVGFPGRASLPEAGARDHVYWDSNTSRLPSLAEAMALYAANFGNLTAGSEYLSNPQSQAHLVGAVQPFTRGGVVNDDYQGPAEDNVPRGWSNWVQTAAATPSGHAMVDLAYGSVHDRTLAGHISSWPVVL
jgi:hypothetical protein